MIYGALVPPVAVLQPPNHNGYLFRGDLECHHQQPPGPSRSTKITSFPFNMVKWFTTFNREHNNRSTASAPKLKVKETQSSGPKHQLGDLEMQSAARVKGPPPPRLLGWWPSDRMRKRETSKQRKSSTRRNFTTTGPLFVTGRRSVAIHSLRFLDIIAGETHKIEWTSFQEQVLFNYVTPVGAVIIGLKSLRLLQ